MRMKGPEKLHRVLGLNDLSTPVIPAGNRGEQLGLASLEQTTQRIPHKTERRNQAKLPRAPCAICWGISEKASRATSLLPYYSIAAGKTNKNEESSSISVVPSVVHSLRMQPQ